MRRSPVHAVFVSLLLLCFTGCAAQRWLASREQARPVRRAKWAFGALVVGGLAVLRSLLLPVFSSLYAVPIVVLYPIFTAWLGIGSESKIAFAGVYGFFPVMLSTAAGIRTIDQHLLLASLDEDGIALADVEEAHLKPVVGHGCPHRRDRGG